MTIKTYLGDIGVVILLDCGQNITSASNYLIKVKRPDGTLVTWTASLSGTNSITYTTVGNDLNQTGNWLLQSYITGSGFALLGDTVLLIVSEAFT